MGRYFRPWFYLLSQLFMPWKRLEKNSKGRFTFSGKRLLSRELTLALSDEEIEEISVDLKQFIKDNNGLVDYIIPYENGVGFRVLCECQISVDDIEDFRASGQFTEEEIEAFNYWAIRMDYERQDDVVFGEE